MLLKLVNNLEFDRSILVVDSVSQSGYSVLRALVQSARRRHMRIICLDIDGTAEESCCILSDEVVIPFMGMESLSSFDKITDQFTSDNIIIAIPTLAMFLIRFGIQMLASLIRLLKSHPCVKYVMGLIHADVVLDREHLLTVKYLFSTQISVQPIGDLSPHYNGYAKCMRHKPNGKLDTSEEYYIMEKDFSIQLVHASTSSIIKNLVETSKENNLMPGLTFNLTLSEKERVAKNSLQLPYLKKEEEKAVLLNSRSAGPHVSIGQDNQSDNRASSSKIYYQYDEADDFDDEDPDDDLDI